MLSRSTAVALRIVYIKRNKIKSCEWVFLNGNSKGDNNKFWCRIDPMLRRKHTTYVMVIRVVEFSKAGSKILYPPLKTRQPILL